MFTKFIDFINENHAPKQKVHKYIGIIYKDIDVRLKDWTHDAEYIDVGTVENALGIINDIQRTGKYKGREVYQSNVYSAEDLNGFNVPLKKVIPYSDINNIS
jgi:hypothetical protein